MTPGIPEGIGLSLKQGWVIAAATWVQEDVPTITAALLTAGGKIHPVTAFLACFLGIWLGDVALYLAARWLGRPLLDTRLGRCLASPAAVERTEAWFARRGLWLLAISRLIPGTRLPTYLAAGFLRVSLIRFSLVTAGAVAVWTAAIFAIAQIAAPSIERWLVQRPTHVWLLPVGVFALWLGARMIWRSRIWREHWKRWVQWEFWPAWLFYLPVIARYVQLSIRYRGWTLPTSANPGMTTGGIVGESKFVTLLDLQQTSPEFTAEAWILPEGPADERLTVLRRLTRVHGIQHPYILKPDVGQRGVGVRLVRDEKAEEDYLTSTAESLVVQRYVPGPLEAGVFYYRLPHEEHGRIFAITEKIFPEIVGDGRRTVEELIVQDERARLISEIYLRRFEARRGEILPAGVSLRLVEAGNHAQGCIFRDGERLHTAALERRIDEISQGIPGFFIGRYDLRYSSEHELRLGKGFRILELNGAAAEATSIYDARTSLRKAYATLFRQWELVFAIGAANRTRGHAPNSIASLLRAWHRTRASIRTYPLAD
jgi:membrane protein DedA with SNARE-associated domain